MQITALDTSLEDFSFEIYFLDYRSDVEEVSKPNYEDVIYVRCYPKWDIREKELMNLIEENMSFLFSKIQVIVEENDLFYCHFDIDYTTIIGTTTNVVDRKVRWIEARPNIQKKIIDGSSTGFIDPNELPPEN